MTKRRLTIALALPVVLLASILLCTLYLALHTSMGAHWILAALEGQLPGKLEMAEPEGNLDAGLLLPSVSYVEPELSVKADRIRLAISLEIFPLAVRINTLHIQSLNVEQLSDEPGQSSPGDTLTSLALPIPVYLDDLLINGLLFTNQADAPGYTADRLAIIGWIHREIQVDKLVLEKDRNHLLLDGNLGLAEPYPVEMSLGSELSLNLQDGSEPTDLGIQATFQGSLAQQLELKLASQEPLVTARATLRNLLGKPDWQLELESSGLRWPLDSNQHAEISSESLSVTSTGNVENYRLSASGKIQLPDLAPHQFDLQSQGTLYGLQVHQLELKGPATNLTAAGELNWREGFDVSLTSTLNYLNPAAWLADWPENHPLRGELDFSLQDQSLRVSRLHLETDDSTMSLDGSGEANLELGTLASEISWKDIQWPVGSEQPDIQSRLGRILLSGNLDDWNVTGEAQLETSDLPAGTLRLEANGDRDQVALTIHEGQILGGVVHGDAKYNWTEGDHWSANLVTEGLETYELHAALPGSLNADLSAIGKLEPFHLDLDIRRMEGNIRDRQMAAGGRLQIQAGQLEFTDVRLTSDESTVTLNGSTSSTRGVAFSANIADLGSFLAHSSGSIEASGRLSLKPGNPSLRLDLEGRKLVWEEIQLPQISIHDYADSKADDIARLHLEGEYLQFGEQMLDNISLDFDLARSTQAIRMTVRKSGLELSAGLSGTLHYDETAYAASEWAGQLRSLSISENEQEIFTLLEPAGIELSSDQVAINATCLGSGVDAKLCLDAGWSRDGALNANLKLTKLPLELLNSILDSDLELSQHASGELTWASRANQPANGHAEIHLSPGEVRYAGETDSLFKTGPGLIGFELQDGSLSSGNLDIPLPGLGEIDLDVNIPQATAGLNSELDGRLRVELNDLDILAIFIPVINRAEGHFNADLVLSGSPANPFLSGPLSLTDGLIANEASGLRLSDIQLSGNVIKNANSIMTGSFRAREGTGQLKAAFDFTDILSPRLELGLYGKNLALLDAPDLKVIAEPDIQLAWQDGVIDIGGKLLIPKAHIAPSVLPESTVSTSPDLVIVAGEIPGAKAEDESMPDIAIRGDFEVVLGDEVELDLSVAVAQVDGSVKFSWQDDLIPLANGSYRMVGEIQAFGQLLQITEANIGFPGVPADNPHLNIRAERQIYGNSEIRRAGVFVTGTLRRPIVEPYTDPMTNRERAQTLLITGSDFNMETGVGAVDIGTYIAPRIFVSYGIGVFEDENVISIRYDLGRNWGVKATSGQRQTGLDISYTIEH